MTTDSKLLVNSCLWFSQWNFHLFELARFQVLRVLANKLANISNSHKNLLRFVD